MAETELLRSLVTRSLVARRVYGPMVLLLGGAGGSCSSREEHLPIEAPAAQRGELLFPAPSLSVPLLATPPLAATALACPFQRRVPLPPPGCDRMSACRFLHSQCDQDLFTSEYLRCAVALSPFSLDFELHKLTECSDSVCGAVLDLILTSRSNKASGHKNLRCFPHCCGGHNPKSFCGSGLVVESAIPNCQLVLGRFEEVAKLKKSASAHVDDTDNNSTSSNEGNSLIIGREYVRDELMTEVKVPEQPFGKWFRGTLVPVGVSSNNSNANSSRFLINGNRQSWHYGWQSSRLNCKNLHVFKVYFFSESADHTLVCEGALSSPAFRISSSRKARKTFRSPVLLSSMSVDGSSVNSGGGSNGALLPRGVPSIDELLDHQNPTSTSRHDVLGSIDPRLLPPSVSNVNGLYYSSNGYSAISGAPVDPARRERKRMTRLTRSGSLKSEYFTATSFQPTTVDMNSPMSLADSFVNQRLASTTARSPPLAPPHQSQLLPSVASLHSGTGNSSGSSRMHVRRSSLAALPMPTPTMASSGASRPMSVLTPITGMMQLTLQTPRQPEGSVGSATVPPLSSYAPPPPPPPPASSLPSSSLGYYDRLQSRRESWSSGMALRQSLLQQQSLPPSIVVIPLSPSSHFPNRKRNRSTDSDKALFIGPGGPLDEPNALPLPVNSLSGDGLAQSEVDTDLYRRARILQLAYMIIKRIHRFDQVHKPAEAKVYRHSFEMVTPSGTARRPTATLVQIPLTNHQLLHLCSMLVAISHALLATKGFLQELRDRLMHCAQSGLDHHAAYAQVVTFIDDAVREQIAQLPRRSQGPSMQQPDSPTRELYDLLKSCEPWLLQEPWWCLHDDDDEEENEENGQQQRRLPYWRVFLDYYGAIEAALPSPRDLEVSAALRDAATSRSTGGLTGEWHRHIDADDLNKPLRMNGGGGVAPSSTTLSSSSLLPFASLSWVERMLYAQTTQLLNVTETATTMTLSLPNGPISPHSVFLLELDKPEPTVLGPQDIVFPFGWSRKKQLVAYRAWRVRDLNDQNGSAVAVQFMRWPDNSQGSNDENDYDEDEEDDVFEPEQEPEVSAFARLRTRLTIYFGVGVETNRVLQVRTIVEGSAMGPGSPMSDRDGSSVAPPTEADMVRYFKSPSSWELMAQVTQQYELV